MSLSDRMAIFMDGRIVQIGTPEEVFSRPATVEVAAFLGNPPMNVLPARLAGGRATVGGASFEAPELAPLGEREVTLGIRPSELSIGRRGPPATVTLCELLGEDVIVDLDLGGQLLRVKIAGRPRIAEGEQVHVSFASRRCMFSIPRAGCASTSEAPTGDQMYGDRQARRIHRPGADGQWDGIEHR